MDLLVKTKLIYLYRVDLFTFTLILRHIYWKLWTSIKVLHRLGKHLSICFLILLFFLQLAEFNLKAPPYLKTLHYLRISISCAPLPFRSIYNQDRGNSSCVNVALAKKSILFIYFFCLLLRPLLLKAQFNLVPVYILKNHGVHPVLLRKWAELPGFFISPKKRFLHHKYANKGFYKGFALQRSFVVILWISEARGTCKMNIKMAIKSRSYILDLDRVKLSLGIFFFLNCLMESFFTSFQDLPLFLSKTHTTKQI